MSIVYGTFCSLNVRRDDWRILKFWKDFEKEAVYLGGWRFDF